MRERESPKEKNKAEKRDKENLAWDATHILRILEYSSLREKVSCNLGSMTLEVGGEGI